jgi:CheY-like chemotaxis protein
VPTSQIFLVVEDNERNRALARNLLEHQRFAVIEAENEDGAVREVKQQRPDMIIMDIHCLYWTAN